MASTPPSLVRRALRFMSVFLMALLTCGWYFIYSLLPVSNVATETIAGSISSTPALLAPILSLISRGLLLLLAVGIFCDMHPTVSKSTLVTPSTVPPERQRENEGRPPSTGSPRRDSSPAPHTWPFPASLAHTPSTYNDMMPQVSSGYLRLPFMILAAQTAAVVCAAFTIALAIILEHAPPSIVLQARNSSRTFQYHARRSGSSKTTDVAALIIAHSVFSLIWALAVVTGVYCKHIWL